MRARLRWIETNDFDSWGAFEAAEIPEPWDHFGWFTLGIGVEGEEGTTNFQVCVATPVAVGRAAQRGGFRGIVVDSFEPEVIRRKLEDFVSSLQGLTWEDLLTQLRQVMHWEYEGMGGR